jgi:hypothetical protein
MTKTPAAARSATAPVRSPAARVPDLGYTPVPDIFSLPEDMNFGACSSVAINSSGHSLRFCCGRIGICVLGLPLFRISLEEV